jgi:DNA-binding response OmpR family regulator
VKKVLIVDDQHAAARLLATLLKLDGYDAREVTDWKDLVHEMEVGQPDLVILDVHLSDIDGFELLQHIRAHPNAGVSSVPVLLISALDYGHKTETSGASGFLLKPFNHRNLLEAMQKIERDVAPA